MIIIVLSTVQLEKGINEMDEEVIKLEKKVDSSEKNNGECGLMNNIIIIT